MLEIEERLRRWASYRYHFALADAVGWAKINSVCGIGSAGGASFPTTGVCLIAEYSDAQQTDLWLNQLGKQFPDLHNAIAYYYITPVNVDNGLKTTMMQRVRHDLGISRRTLLQRVHDGKIWLAGALSIHQEAKLKNGSQ